MSGKGAYRYILDTCPECYGAGGFTSGASIDGPGEDDDCKRCHGTGKIRRRVPEVSP